MNTYYRGKDKSASGENEIDLIIEENGILYPVEITGEVAFKAGVTVEVEI
ncbi:MAG: hypothetical protein IJ695_02145 [Butyrivibrio sp.]|nr:hypothetical protein [Butyrivibrio sp.]